MKFSWNPDSSAALIAINFKDGEDWILVRVSEGKARSTYFDGDKLLSGKMLDDLPFQQKIASSAPVGRTPWETVHWNHSKQRAMTFIFRGIGYEGTAHLLIDFKRDNPRFKILSISPGVDPELWKQH